jgi:uncharacterized protein (TIGR02217 family)
MSFHEVQFPTSLSFGSLGGPERRSEIVTFANGFEERNSPWAHSRRRYDAGLGLRSLEDIEKLVAFFEARQGQLHAFRWKDWTDYKSCRAFEVPSFEDQVIGEGDGVTKEFTLKKSYRSGEQAYVRPIAKPVSGTVTVGFSGDKMTEGVDWSVDVTSGVIAFVHPPDDGVVITSGYEFDVPVRFNTDMIQTSVASFQAGEVPNIPVIEVRL